MKIIKESFTLIFVSHERRDMEVVPEAGLKYPWAVVAVHTLGLVWAEALNFFLKFRNDLKS